MATRTHLRQIPYAPTEPTDLYPESDGKPMADTDLHLYWIKRIQDVIETFLLKHPGTYISGNIMMYDIEGPMRTAVSPDILVAFGLGKKFRRTYKVWEEGKPPDFVMEFSSRRTFRNDLDEKKAHYARMKIPAYFLYDPDRRYLPSPLMGFRLVEGRYVEITPDADGGIYSDVLGISFHLTEDGLALYDPVSESWLKTRAEQEAERAEQEAERAEQEAERAEQEAERAEQEAERAEQEAAARQKAEAEVQKAEAEVERLEAELARLKARL